MLSGHRQSRAIAIVVGATFASLFATACDRDTAADRNVASATPASSGTAQRVAVTVRKDGYDPA